MKAALFPLYDQGVNLPDTKNDIPDTLLSNVFNDNTGSYLNNFNLYLAYYRKIPIVITEIKINCKSANKWFLTNFHNQIIDNYYNRIYFSRTKKQQVDDVFYFLYDDLMVHFDTNHSKVTFFFKKTDEKLVLELSSHLKKFKVRSPRSLPQISVLVNTIRGIDLKSLEIHKARLRIQDNYNDDFIKIHDTIYNRLSKRNDKGIVLLHGRPGTGKTSYLRYLIATVKKNIILLPPDMAAAITNPDLMNILIDNKNSILVIEDAENIVVSRDKNSKSPVSALLNIADGLLSDCLNIQVICSFNTDISKIDGALLRKGRLIAKYEFRELSAAKANALSVKLGFNKEFTQPASLADIYNQSEDFCVQDNQSQPLGFKLS